MFIRRRRSAENRSQLTLGMAHGCLFALASTLVTCLLLFVNGGLMSAICSIAISSGPDWLRDARTIQFLLFVGPVLLVVIQWMMIDYVINRIRRLP